MFTVQFLTKNSDFKSYSSGIIWMGTFHKTRGVRWVYACDSQKCSLHWGSKQPTRSPRIHQEMTFCLRSEAWVFDIISSLRFHRAICKSQGHQSLHAGSTPIFAITARQLKFPCDFEISSCSMYKIPTTFFFESISDFCGSDFYTKINFIVLYPSHYWKGHNVSWCTTCSDFSLNYSPWSASKTRRCSQSHSNDFH